MSIYDLLGQNKLSSTNAKIVFKELANLVDITNVEEYANEKGYIQVSDDNEITAIVDEVLNDISSEKAVADYKNGNEKVLGFLVGQVMKKSGGKANPSKVQEIIKQRIK
jgi:aspartyl-tRNA(Asn)/glutamyl-tRNA(Gln) amidotransferase subunit B